MLQEAPRLQTHLLEHLLLRLAQLLILDLPLAELPLQLLNVPAQCQFVPGDRRGQGGWASVFILVHQVDFFFLEQQKFTLSQL